MRARILSVLAFTGWACGGQSAGPTIEALPPVDAGAITVLQAPDASSGAAPPTDASCALPGWDGSLPWVLFPFDTAADVAAWTVDPWCTGADAGAGCDGFTSLSAASTLTFDPTTGAGGVPGSMEIQIPFSGFNQQAAFRHIFSCPVDLSNRTLFLWLRLDSGFAIDPRYPGGVILSVRTGPTQVYASGTYFNLPPGVSAGSWMELELPMTDVAYVPTGQLGAFDPTQVDLLELAFTIGAVPAFTVDVSAPSPATFHVDTVGFF